MSSASRASSRARGHRVLVLAPSRSQERVRASRRALRESRAAGGSREGGAKDLLTGTDGGTPRVIAVGEVLDLQSTARPAGDPGYPAARAGPADRRRAHDRGTARAASRWTSSTCTSRSRRAPPTRPCATRARSTSAPSTRRPSGCSRRCVARRFVETFFGRLDARTASLPATAELMARHFPGDYRLLDDEPTARTRPPTSSRQIYRGSRRADTPPRATRR